MNIQVRTEETVQILTLPKTPLDSATAKHFAEAAGKITEDNPRVVMDLSLVPFIDSAGLGSILALVRELTQRGGDLKICGLNKGVRALFQLVRMHKVVEVFETPEEATRAFAVA